MKLSPEKALENWLGAMEQLLSAPLAETTERVNFHEYNDPWAKRRFKRPRLKASLEGNFLRFKSQEQVYSLAYPVFGISRGILLRSFPIGFVRTLDEKGFMMPRGSLMIDRALQCCFKQSTELIEALWLDGSVDKLELVLLRDRVLHYCNYDVEQFLKLEELCERLKIPDEKHFDFLGTPSTNAKAIKNLLDYVAKKRLKAEKLVPILFELRGLLGALQDSKIIRLADSLDGLRVLRDHTHPMVRDLYLVVLNKICGLLFENGLQKKGKLCHEYLEILIDEGVNLDLNLARKSIIDELLFGKARSIETWNKLLELVESGHRLAEVGSFYDDTSLKQWRAKTKKELKL